MRLRPGDRSLPRVEAAREAFERELGSRSEWYRSLAIAIADAEPAPRPEEDPSPGAAVAGQVVLERGADGDGVPPGLAIAWAHRHLELLRELEPPLARAADSIGG